MHVNKPEIWKKRFPRVLSRNLYSENKTYKLKRFVGGDKSFYDIRNCKYVPF